MNSKETAGEILGSCPACARPTKHAELSANAGTCQFCRRAFAIAHKRPPTEPAPHEAGTINVLDHETAVVDGQLIEVVHFDFDSIDETLGFVEGTSADARAEAAELLSALWVWIFPPQTNMKSALVRFVAVAAGLRPDLCSGSYKELAAELGVTKQSVSKAALRFQSAFKFKFARSRSLAARRNMGRSQVGHPFRGRREMALDQSVKP